MDLGDAHRCFRGGGGADGFDVRGFDPEVEFLADRVGETVGALDGAETARPPGSRLEPFREPADDVRVTLDEPPDPRTLDLHDDLFARPQLRSVDLRDGGRGERPFVESCEHLRRTRPELGGERRLKLGEWHRRHRVLQRRELGDHVRRQEVGTCREDLPELDEDPAGVLEGAPQTSREGAGALGSWVDTQADVTAHSVACRDPHDLRVPRGAGGLLTDRADRVDEGEHTAGETRGDRPGELEDDEYEHRHQQCGYAEGGAEVRWNGALHGLRVEDDDPRDRSDERCCEPTDQRDPNPKEPSTRNSEEQQCDQVCEARREDGDVWRQRIRCGAARQIEPVTAHAPFQPYERTTALT